MHIDTLESRTHFSGAIVVTISSSSIVVRGTGGDDTIRIGLTLDWTGEPDGGYRIACPGNDIYVNGMKHAEYNDPEIDYDSDDWLKPLRINTGPGNDTVLIASPPIIYNLIVDLGDGDDQMRAGNTAENFTVYGGPGLDRISITSTSDTRLSNVSLFPGTGRDRIDIHSTVEYDRDGILGKLRIDDEKGPLMVNLTGVRVKKETLIRMRGQSIDHITLDGCRFLRPISIQTSGGVDYITATKTSYKSTVQVDADEDDDVIVGF